MNRHWATYGDMRGKVIKYETALKADPFVLMIHGSAAERLKAQEILDSASGPKPV